MTVASMEGSIGPSPQCTGWEHHNTNVNRLVDAQILYRNYLPDVLVHRIVPDYSKNEVSVVVEELLLFHCIFRKESWWRIGDPRLRLPVSSNCPARFQSQDEKQ